MVYWYTSPRPVDTGPSTGVIPGSSRGDTSISRSMTNWRAKNTSVSSVNTSVISDNPLLFMERISTSPGKPVIAISTGHRNQTLDLLRAAADRDGGDLHLYVGHIGESVDGEILCRINAASAQCKRHHHHHQALLSIARTIAASIGLLQFRELALVVQVKGAIQHNALLDCESAHHRAHIGDFGTKFDGNAQEPVITFATKT